MGTNESKAKIEALEKKQDALMKEHADMAKRLADEQEMNRKKTEEALEQMAKLMLLVVAASQAAEKTTKQDKQLLEIEGVTYVVTEFINRGGFGQIYKAHVKNGDRIVAIKAMKNSPLIQREIENEIRFLRLTKQVPLNPHPVIEYYGCQVTTENIFIAMELAQCDLLTFWMQGMDDRTPQEKFAFGLIIIMYTLRALTFLERINIIHGDIKPQNLVMVQSENILTVKLIDFGTVEKLDTLRSLVTVDASKAHTQFFASPEFLRRDSHNLISRRLHKKSDAWAAGVMFYLLFLGTLPWEDEHDYENFVNNARAKDVVIPGEGGYKLIIELLLKKDPEERASAKETLLQLKAHPVLGVIVDALEQTLHPVDDVCNVKIPDNLRVEMASFSTPQKRAQMGNSTSASATGGSSSPGHFHSRRSCRYGRDCYRKNADHREEFAHPGDSDYREMKGQGKVKCRYGAQCHRRDNAEHMAKFAHT